jgi:hypothetical protein
MGDGSRWLIHLMTSDAAPLNVDPAPFPSLVVLVGGAAAELWPGSAFPDRGADVYLMLRGSSADALALARSLTTEVAVVAENRW